MGQVHFFTAQTKPHCLSQTLTGRVDVPRRTLMRGYVGCDIWLLSFAGSKGLPLDSG